jgi:hypothetical protein
MGRTGSEPDHARLLAELPDADARARLILNNAVVEARVFNRRQLALRSALLGVPDYHEAKQTLPLGQRKGVFGHVTFHCSCVEAQRNGGPHDHCLVHGTIIQPDILLRLPNDAVAANHASMIQCGLPPRIHAQHAATAAAAAQARSLGGPQPQRLGSVGLTRSPTAIAEAQTTAEEVASRVNRHSHTFTCVKEKTHGKCRLGVKRRPDAVTRVVFLEDPEASSSDNYSDSDDDGEDDPAHAARVPRPGFMRTGGVTYLEEKRTPGGDQTIIEFSPVLTAALRCNTCVSALGSTTQATVTTYVAAAAAAVVVVVVVVMLNVRVVAVAATAAAMMVVVVVLVVLVVLVLVVLVLVVLVLVLVVLVLVAAAVVLKVDHRWRVVP